METRLNVLDAFRREAESLEHAFADVPEPAFARPSPCPPWTVSDLLDHVSVGAGRTRGHLAEPEPAAGPVITAVEYYKPDERFSPAVNDERIAAAQRGAVALGAGSAVLGEFGRNWRDSYQLAHAAPATRVVRTRHGDLMLLSEFLRTRVLELAVHGLDLAVGLDRAPWLTEEAAQVVEGVILPGNAIDVLEATSWDHAGLIARATGRTSLTEPERRLLEQHGLRRLAFSA
jgi:uncharacterized protein (TIGR03083 family)